jgi:hypothetical protein
MTDGLFKDKAFSSYLPLFNVVAIFVPSNQSGLTDLNSVDTAFGLYRSPAGSKRGILPGKPDIIRAALTLSPSNTDYPIVIANDNSYGGLGGEFAITTRSIESGLMVLRHELGHNFGQVGEEYDGGQVYQGANNSLDGTNPSWNHWISGPVTTSESKLLAGEYLWKNLSGGNISIDFNFPTQIKIQPYLFYALLSTVGWSSPNDVKVFLDGNPIQPEGIFTEDRSFFAIDLRQSLKSGHHTLEFHENLNDGNNIIASARVYALPFDYDFSNTIGAVSVFDVNGFPSGYRPTHNSCIMQNMRSFEFCSIDKENMWVQFLNRVNTIDAVNTTKDIPNKIATVELLTPDLSNLKIRWFRVDRNGKANEILGIKNKRTWTTYPEDKNLYRVEVKLVSPEVLKPSTRFTSTKDFKI